MKNQPIVKISPQFLEGIVIQRLDRWDTSHTACHVLSDFLARRCLKLITRIITGLSLIRFVYLWFS